MSSPNIGPRYAYLSICLLALGLPLNAHAYAQSLDQQSAEEVFPPALNFSDFELIFEDEFDFTDSNGNPALDTYYWTAEEMTNSSPATKRGSFPHPDAVEVMADGTVVLSAYRDTATDRNPNGELRNGVLVTKEKFHATYGYWEATIKWEHLASGTATAFWLMPVATPGSPEVGVEIDIIELRSRRVGGFWSDDPHPFDAVTDINGYEYIIDKNTKEVLNIPLTNYDSSLHKKLYNIEDDLNFGVHWDGYGNNQNSLWGTVQPLGENQSLVDNEFHTYGLLWTPDEYVLYFDGIEVFRAPKADDSNTPNFNEGWLSKETNVNDATLIDYTHPKSGRTQSGFEASDEKAISNALQHILLTIEVRDPNFEPQDNWIGPLEELGPKGASTNTRMVVDSVRVYSMNQLQDQQTPAADNFIPGTIAAEGFDNGPQGVAYTDQFDSQGPGVDISDFGGGDLYVEHIKNREWLEYTIDPTLPGYYNITLQASNPAISYPSTKENDKARSSLFLSIDNEGIGAITIDASTATGAAKVRPYAAPAPVLIECPSVLNVQSITQNTAYVDVNGSTTTIDIEANLDAIDFEYLGNVIEVREAETASLSGAITNNGSYLTNFNSTGTASFHNLPGWEGGAAKLLLNYSVVYNSPNTPFLTVQVNGSTVQLNGADLQLALDADDTLLKVGYERAYYRSLTVDLPAGLLNADNNNTISIVSDGSFNQQVRLDWIALSSEIDLPAPDCDCCENESPATVITHEAEDTTLLGNAYSANSGDASAGSYVNGLWSIGSGFEWTVTADAAGTAELNVYYNYDSTGSVSRSVLVNGVQQGSIQFDGPASTFSDVAQLSIDLVAGSNTIRIERLGNDSGGAIKPDFVEVILSAGNNVPPLDLNIEAEKITATSGEAYTSLVGLGEVGTHSNASGGEYVHKFNKSSSGVEFHLADAVPATDATLSITYSNGGGTDVTKAVDINSTSYDVTFPATTAWNAFVTIELSIPVSLSGDGTDSIRIWRKDSNSADQGSIRVDYINLNNQL